MAVTNAGQVASEEIVVETEKKIKINLADYNFDGHMDFSLSHTDDGMGTYQIYQIYVYSPSEHKFVQLTPKCGDEFINVVLSKPSQRADQFVCVAEPVQELQGKILERKQIVRRVSG